MLIVLSACTRAADGSTLLRTLPDGSSLQLRPAAPALGDRVQLVLDVPVPEASSEPNGLHEPGAPRVYAAEIPVLYGPDGERLSPVHEEAAPGGRRYYWSFRPRQPGVWQLVWPGMREEICTVASALLPLPGGQPSGGQTSGGQPSGGSLSGGSLSGGQPSAGQPAPIFHDGNWLWSGEGDPNPLMGGIR